MQPAFSVIFFTVSTGTGYGLLFLLGLLGAAGKLPANHTFGFIGMALGLALVGAGLLSSMLHLGHPERAWRALSQWKTSWLSREGVASVISFVPGLAMMYLWVFESTSHPMFALFGLATALMAFVTVYCTAMIYRSLPPIHQWANGWTLPNYLFMGLAGGGVVLVGLYGVVGAPLTLAPICAVGALFVLGVLSLGIGDLLIILNLKVQLKLRLDWAILVKSLKWSLPIRKTTICSKKWVFKSAVSMAISYADMPMFLHSYYRSCY